MKNKYVELERVEFLVTKNCTSKCKHCSIENIGNDNNKIDLTSAKNILDKVTNIYNINSIMTFGGESLLYPEITLGIHSYAKNIGIKNRQLITNGYWLKNKRRIDEICKLIKSGGVNDLLLSVDYFHQEYLDFEIIEYTASQLSLLKIENFKLHPCWYESQDSNNIYDIRTNEYLDKLKKYNISISSGNIMFPAEGSLKSFPNKFKPLKSIKKIKCGNIPYKDLPDKIKSICINPNGNVGGLCYINEMELEDFLVNYDPFLNKSMKIFLEKGSEELDKIIKNNKLEFKIKDYYTICSACKSLRNLIDRNKLYI